VTASCAYPMFLRMLQTLSTSWTSEHRFHETRRWRFDFARPDIKLAVEIDGGVWSGGRHSGGSGQIKDMEKNNAAIALGWQVLHFTPQHIRKGDAFRFIQMLHNKPTTTENT
jgi:very-short-patch-repair endonuclease